MSASSYRISKREFEDAVAGALFIGAITIVGCDSHGELMLSLTQQGDDLRVILNILAFLDEQKAAMR